MRVLLVTLVLFFCAITVKAKPPTTDINLSMFFPASNHIAGWTLTEEPKNYRGDELFMMIDGGADIYHEYGFSQALAGEYKNNNGTFIRLEIYEMASPESAYGMYSFKVGSKGKPLPLGQEALLEDYYLNFWKGNLLVTIVGSDSDEETIQNVIAIGRYVDEHYSQKGKQPELTTMLLHEPLAFSHPKYVRGYIGVMNSYIFDTEDIFEVQEGMIGIIDDNQAFVLRYPNENESRQIIAHAMEKISTSPRFTDFTDFTEKDNTFRMIDRNQKFITIRLAGRDIVAVIGREQNNVGLLAKQLVEKLK